MADLGLENLSDETYKTVIERAIEITVGASEQLNTSRATIGLTQERVERADEALQVRLDLLTTQIGALEEVDPYEKSTELNSLLTSLEISYALTGRLQSLHLARYL